MFRQMEQLSSSLRSADAFVDYAMKLKLFCLPQSASCELSNSGRKLFNSLQAGQSLQTFQKRSVLCLLFVHVIIDGHRMASIIHRHSPCSQNLIER